MHACFDLLNPKIALIFLTLLPQFISSDEPPVPTTAALSVAFFLVVLLWWRAFSLTVGSLGRVLPRERIRTSIERITGFVLIGLGLRVAVTAH